MSKKRTDADRRTRQANRMGVILRMLNCLNGRSKWTPKALAEEFEISLATVHRYMNVLQAAGISYYYDKEYGGYRLAYEHRFPVLNFTPDELLAQGIVASVSREQGLSLGKESRHAVSKISAAQRDERSRILEDAQKLIQVLDLKLADHSRHGEIIRTAQWALLDGKQLIGSYSSPYREGLSEIRLHPYRLVLVRKAWYLIARPHDEDAPRTYRVIRFKSLRRSNNNSDVPKDFDVKAYFGNAWGVFRGDQSYQVKLRFCKEAASVVTETKWHATQSVVKHADGEATLSYQVDGLEEILGWILGWAGQVRILEPKELRDMFIAQLRRAMEMNCDS